MRDERPGLLLVHDMHGVDEWLDGLANSLASLGFEVSVPCVHKADEAGVYAPDREVQSKLESALTELGKREAVDRDRLGVIGFGDGGTHAFLLGCASTELGAVAIFDSPIVYPELSREQPIQPLEMALNFSAPLLAVYSSSPAAVEGVHVDQLAQVGSQFAKDFDIVRPDGGCREAYRHQASNASGENQAAAISAATWNRLISFLAECLEIPELEAKSTGI